MVLNRETKTGLWKGFLPIILETGNVSLYMFCGPLVPQEALREIIWEMLHTLPPSWIFWISLSIQKVRRIPVIKILTDFCLTQHFPNLYPWNFFCIYPLAADLHLKKSLWKICVKSGTLEYRAHLILVSSFKT